MFFPPDIEPGIFCFSGKCVNNNTKVPLMAVSLSLQILSIKGTCYLLLAVQRWRCVYEAGALAI